MDRYSKHLGVMISILIYGSVYVYLNAIHPALAAQSVRSGGLPNVGVVLNHLRPVLYAVGKSARIEYSGVCEESSNPYPVRFPSTEVQPLLDGATGLTAVRDMFGRDKKVTVTEGEDGVIRIKIGNVWDAILKTKISRLMLDQDDQYNPLSAIWVMLGTKAMQIAMTKFHASHPFLIESIETSPTKGQPHLPPSMVAVTADQVLNSIAKTFKGIVVYSECTQLNGTHLFDIEFFDITSSLSKAYVKAPSY